MSYLSRTFLALARFSKCGERIGWSAAVKIYLSARLLGRPVSIKLPNSETAFRLRGGKIDLGSFATFYLGYPTVSGIKIDTILDGGANIGDSAVLLAQTYNPRLIIAAEPEEENFRQLEINVRHFACIVPMQCALWTSDSIVNLHEQDGSSVGAAVSLDAGGKIVSARSIESLMKEHKIQGFDLVKLDIEGAEREILQNSENEWLQHCKVLILELHDQLSPGAGMALVGAVSRWGQFQMRQAGEYLVFLRQAAGESPQLHYRP
jgi:FkbM family methyltransferase